MMSDMWHDSDRPVVSRKQISGERTNPLSQYVVATQHVQRRPLYQHCYGPQLATSYATQPDESNCSNSLPLQCKGQDKDERHHPLNQHVAVYVKA
jgi:hypothetical protein